jgi:hypothetical protein
MPKFALKTVACYDDAAPIAAGSQRRGSTRWQRVRPAWSVAGSDLGSALLPAAGLGERSAAGNGSRDRKRSVFTDEELLSELRVVSEKLRGRPVTVEAFHPLGRSHLSYPALWPGHPFHD